MRITAGKWRGRKLEAPEGTDVRPTSDMVRQAIFNILQGYGHPQDSFVLDAFCGTGALGLEALSRGAAHCFFMDIDKKSLSYASRNIANAKAEHCIAVHADALDPGSFGGEIPATLLFLDPPYRKGLINPALSALAGNGWLEPGALCVAECEKDLAAQAPPGFALLADRAYGGTRVLFLRYTGDKAAARR
jgi:16S rRNA (guanine966-N2)-methyltransferase